MEIVVIPIQQLRANKNNMLQFMGLDYQLLLNSTSSLCHMVWKNAIAD